MFKCMDGVAIADVVSIDKDLRNTRASSHGRHFTALRRIHGYIYFGELYVFICQKALCSMTERAKCCGVDDDVSHARILDFGVEKTVFQR